MKSSTLKTSFDKTVVAVLLCGLAFLGGACHKKEKKTLISSDGRFEISVPGGWKQEKKLHEDAEIQASHYGSNKFVLVIAEIKEDFNNIDLTEYSQITRDGMTQKLKSPEQSGPLQLTISGLPAIQYEIRGGLDFIKLVYLHTSIESPTHFYQVIAWTTPSVYKKDNRTFEKITEYFAEY